MTCHTRKRATYIINTVALAIVLIYGLYSIHSHKSSATAAIPCPAGDSCLTCTDSLFAASGLELPLQEGVTSQLIKHVGYTVSYNADWHLPNWVAYELSSQETDGVEERSNHFKPDPLVLGDPVVTKDYSNSGYDRGHMAPAADMKWSEQAMQESFYMTNMCPQNHNLNAGDWKVLEEQIRHWAEQYEHIYICCGPIVSDTTHTIGTERKIVIPQAFYKVILRQKGSNWTGIGFIMANRPRDGKWSLSHYAMTIEDLEIVTGIDFFHSLPDSIEEQVETCYHLSDWDL